MSNSTNSTICVIQSNSDVDGIGIRLSLYILAFLAPLVATFHKSKEVSRSFQNALGANSLALLLTAVIQTARDQLTLFHAICVIHLLTLLGLTSLSSEHDNRRGSFRGVAGTVLYFMGLFLFIVFNLYVWISAPRFGSQVQCNPSTIYVVFGGDISPTDDVFRWLIVTATCLGLVGIVFSVCIFQGELKRSFYRLIDGLEQGNGSENYIVFAVLVHLGTWVYAVVAFEQTLNSNHLSSGEFQWSFGQILAMVLLIGPLFDLVTSFRREEGGAGMEADDDDDDSSFAELAEGYWARVWLNILLGALQIAASATGGVVAAAAGAHFAGHPTTAFALQTGGIAGALASTLVLFASLANQANSGKGWFLAIFAGSAFGIGALIATIISQRVYVEQALLIATMAGVGSLNAVPLAGRLLFSMCGDCLSALDPYDDAQACCVWTLIIAATISVASGTFSLCGYIIARVAENHGLFICPWHVGAAAGAVFGLYMGSLPLILTFLPHYLTALFVD